MDEPLIKVIEYFIGNMEFDFNTPRSESNLVINTKKFLLPIYGNNTRVVVRFSEYVPEKICTPYPDKYNENIVFRGKPVLSEKLDLTDIEYRIEDGKLILPRLRFVKSVLDKSKLSAYYYLYRQQLLSDAVNRNK